MRQLLSTLALAGSVAFCAPVQAQAQTPGRVSPSGRFKPWINGVSASEPPVQVQQYDADTFVLRQSIRTNFEGPFMYLLFGGDLALLLDTGAGGIALRPVVDAVIAAWEADHGHVRVRLIVAHTHSHGDHHQGDAEFIDRPDTTVVGLYPKDVADFFRIDDWPRQIVQFNLGPRALHIIPTPGHQGAHIMVFDEQTRLLISGDSLGPYRLYVPANATQEYRDSIDRVAAFLHDKSVSWILGAHIEMTTKPGELIVNEAPSHPDERALEIPYTALPELQAALHAAGGTLVEEAHNAFVIFPTPARPQQPYAPPTITDAAKAHP